jgi:hypothetical protein
MAKRPVEKPHFLQIRVSESERETFKKKASALGISVSDLIRQAVTRPRVRSGHDREIAREKNRQLGWIGNNLNQIARAVNTQGVINHELDLLKKLDSIQTEIRAALDAH